ncbi:HAD family hydrolase [Cellulomonas edaphi]|uniref:HAD family hydrolase n=1 Tax=Cellulomonas edaphi TaxID=3053468 RepID=A0ABT7S7K6_9CELL|nr:HAD family hydrolase [Cellulomons edaphi]MDM7830914.1 HAD family hydrolase [Cellulomons edaphi]
MTDASLSSRHWPTTAPRLVATDLDNTLLGPDGRVSARTQRALAAAAEAGIAVVFVSARPLRRLRELAEHVAGHGIAICSNGAAVFDVGADVVLAEEGMAPAEVACVAGALRAAWGAQNVHFATEHAGGFDKEAAFTESYAVPAGSRVAESIEDVLTPSTLKLLVRTSLPWDETFARRVAAVIGDAGLVADSGAPGLGEISRTGVTKAATLERWAADLGIGPHDVWAFGDAPNDLPMLRWAGASFAVANAFPEVRAAATHTCPSNADDGVARVLEHAVGLGSTR